MNVKESERLSLPKVLSLHRVLQRGVAGEIFLRCIYSNSKLKMIEKPFFKYMHVIKGHMPISAP